MSWRIISATLAASWLFSGLGYSQQAAPTFEVKSFEMPPVGSGLPAGKPIDILGLHTGMPADSALKIVADHYKQQNLEYRQTMMRLQHAAQPFLGYVKPPVDGTYKADFLSVALTSNAAGNQVVGIRREVRYPDGKEASTEQTLAAILAKYGQPTTRIENSSEISLSYAYRNGELLKGPANVCDILGHPFRQSQPDFRQASADNWYSEMSYAVQNNPRPNRCSAFLDIRLYLKNPKAVEYMIFGFFDADRFVIAHNQAVAAQKELNEKAKAAAPSGSGSSKL